MPFDFSASSTHKQPAHKQTAAVLPLSLPPKHVTYTKRPTPFAYHQPLAAATLRSPLSNSNNTKSTAVTATVAAATASTTPKTTSVTSTLEIVLATSSVASAATTSTDQLGVKYLKRKFYVEQ